MGLGVWKIDAAQAEEVVSGYSSGGGEGEVTWDQSRATGADSSSSSMSHDLRQELLQISLN